MLFSVSDRKDAPSEIEARNHGVLTSTANVCTHRNLGYRCTQSRRTTSSCASATGGDLSVISGGGRLEAWVSPHPRRSCAGSVDVWPVDPEYFANKYDLPAEKSSEDALH
jgi:hypothetical protein